MSTLTLGREENGVRKEYGVILDVVASHVNNPVDVIKGRYQQSFYLFRRQPLCYLGPLLLHGQACILDIMYKHFGLGDSWFIRAPNCVNQVFRNRYHFYSFL